MPNEDNAAEPAYTKLVPIPAGINPGVSAAKHKTMLQLLGKPGALTENCSDVTNADLAQMMTTKNVGPFSVEGLKPAVAALTRIFKKVKAERPGLYGLLRSDGMLCVRRVRRPADKPPSKNFSNHSWGTALDVKIGSKRDSVGDAKALFGLVALYPYFHEEQFYWGAGFKPADKYEDAMHFEVSEELIRKWADEGLLG